MLALVARIIGAVSTGWALRDAWGALSGQDQQPATGDRVGLLVAVLSLAWLAWTLSGDTSQ